MGKTVGIFGMSGDGKSTSIVINPDGSFDTVNYKGMNPKTTYIINADKKDLPFPNLGWSPENKNLAFTSDLETIMGEGVQAGKNYDKMGILGAINTKRPEIKSIIIDTINGVMVDIEMLESKKMTYDKWMDLAKSIYELITVCNSLRDDLVIYLTGHVTLYTDVDGNESKCLVTNGKKLEKIKLESKLPIVLYTNVDKGTDGDNKHYFETRKNRSTAKTPIGMFKDFLIPNSLSLVDSTIRDYYKLGK
jgi:hypothetical protein